MDASRPLDDLFVVELSTGIAGAYATKLFVDAGARVVKVEPATGDPLRKLAIHEEDLEGRDAALFDFLCAGKTSVLGSPADPEVERLIAAADVVVEGGSSSALDVEALAAHFPSLVIVSITPWGRSGPWRDRPATEFTVQAESGSLATRGLPGGEPFQAAGRTAEWVSGLYAAVASLAAVHRARSRGVGERVDVSMLEAMALSGTHFIELTSRLRGDVVGDRLPQTVETPSIEPTADGFVGFCTNTRQQISDFMLLIERPDLVDDEELAMVAGRIARFEEWTEIVRNFTRRHTTAEILERAAALRIPAAPVLDAAGALRHAPFVERGVFVPDASHSRLVPRRPYRIDGDGGPPPGKVPRPGEHDGRRPPARRSPRSEGPEGAGLPLEGLRIIDFTCWWAGPSATQILASLGAEVIHIESTRHIDGARLVGGSARHRFPEWWEASALFASVNTNKKGVTLDLSDPRGRELFGRLLADSDGLVENFTPRVLEGFGFDFSTIGELNPEAIVVRMPAFGLDGSWRDHPGFAQTMEQVTGLAWITGHEADQPRVPRGPCDPISGMHAAWAFLVGLRRRERSGRGSHIECTMVEAALNVAAQALLEAEGPRGPIGRMGNRSPNSSPQGLYACAGSRPGAERWLALCVETDGQWEALVEVLGRPEWAIDAAFARHGGRRAAEAEIDRGLRDHFAGGERDHWLEVLLAAGVPVGEVRDPRRGSGVPQMRARGFYEEIDHPVLGRHPVVGLPFRFASVDRWIRTPAPTVGRDSREILSRIVGVSAEDLDRLEADGVIGTRVRFD